MSSKVSSFVGAVGVSPAVDGGRDIGVPIGSARLRLDGIGTVRTGEAAGAGVATVDGVGRGHGIRGGVLTFRADMGGVPPGPKTLSTAGMHYQ